MAEGVDRTRSIESAPQRPQHAGSSSPPRTRASCMAPHSRHLYSKIGIISSSTRKNRIPKNLSPCPIPIIGPMKPKGRPLHSTSKPLAYGPWGRCPWRSLVKSLGTRLGEAQCRRSREFPLSEARRSSTLSSDRRGRVSGIRIPRAAGHARRTGQRFHSASERDIPPMAKDAKLPRFIAAS
jgi:hypothetical protein